MTAFATVAGLIAALHLVAMVQRPRAAVFLSGILWALYACWEYLIATGVLCDDKCNIRVDLVFIFPILALATWCAWRSFMGRPGQLKIIGAVLGGVGVLALGLYAEGHGYGLVFWAVVLAAVAIGLIYAKRSKSPANWS